MKRNIFISILLSVCMVLSITPTAFMETVNAETSAYEEAVLIDLTKQTQADNYFALRNNNAGGYFNSTSWERAFDTSTTMQYGGEGVSGVWSNMDGYGLYAHSAVFSTATGRREETSTVYDEKYTGDPKDGVYLLDTSGLSEGKWTDASDSRSPRRNMIQLSTAWRKNKIDISKYSYVNLVLYSEKATNDTIRLSLLNGNTSQKTDTNMDFKLDWSGEWKTISVPLGTLSSPTEVNNFSLVNRGVASRFDEPVDNDNKVYIAKVYLSNVLPRLDIVDLTGVTSSNLWDTYGDFSFAYNYHTNGYYNTTNLEQAWEYTDTVQYKNKGYSLVWDKMNYYGLYNHTGKTGVEDSTTATVSTSIKPIEGSYIPSNKVAAISDGNWIPVDGKWTIRTARRNSVHLSPHRYCKSYYEGTKGQQNGKGKDFELENYKYINLVMYSEKRTDEKIRLSLINSNTNSSHNIKFTYTFNLNWEDGWKTVSIPLDELEPTNSKYDIYTVETTENASTDSNNTVRRFALENRGKLDIDYPQVDNENKVYLSQVYMSTDLGDGVDVFVDDKMDVSISSDEYTVSEDNKIHGYADMTVSELKQATKVGDGVIYNVYNADNTPAEDSAKCIKGMYIKSQTKSESQSKIYTLDVKDHKIYDIQYRVNDTILNGNFTKGTVEAWVNIDAYKPTSAAIAVAYYKDNTLSGISFNENKAISGINQKLETSLSGIDEVNNAKVKIMLWDSMSSLTPVLKPLELTPLQSGDMSSLSKVYPNYSQKAVTLSYDDGADSDETLINDYLNKYNLKATFNIQTNWFDNKNELQKQAFTERYSGHEIANHTNQHPRWSQHAIDPYIDTIEGTLTEMQTAQDKILQNTGKASYGGAWSYDGPSFREDSALITGLNAAGIEYIRRSEGSGSFELPQNWMMLKATCRHDSMAGYSESFIDLETVPSLDTKTALKMFYVWGHSWEFVPGNTGTVKWTDLDTLLSPFADRDTYWAATNIELCRYVKAMDEAVINNEECTIYNPSDVDLYFTGAGQRIVVKAGETAKIFEN